jgi:hypothetical protein
MDILTAKKNIGQPFKVDWLDKWDVIRSVTNEGMIIGDQVEAEASDCRLKEPQPDAFKNRNFFEQHLDVDSNGNCYSDADPGL